MLSDLICQLQTKFKTPFKSKTKFHSRVQTNETILIQILKVTFQSLSLYMASGKLPNHQKENFLGAVTCKITHQEPSSKLST